MLISKVKRMRSITNYALIGTVVILGIALGTRGR